MHSWADPLTIAQADVDAFGAFDFRLAYVDQGAAYAALYQQYRIDKVELFFRPMYRANPALATPLFIVPLIFTAVDLNDISSWGAMSSAQRAAGVVVHDDSGGFGVSFTPRVAMAVYAGAFTAFAAPAERPWLDTGSDAVRHFGLKWAILGGGIGATAEQVWNVAIRYTVSFRLPR